MVRVEYLQKIRRQSDDTIKLRALLQNTCSRMRVSATP